MPGADEEEIASAAAARPSGPLGLRDNLIGCLAIAAFLLFLLTVAIGYPVSFYCLGALLCWGVIKLTRSELDSTDSEGSDIKARVMKAALGGAESAALWIAIGTAGVWTVQLALRLGLSIAPAQAADLQLRAFDLAAALKATLTLAVTLATIGAALLLALLVDRLWPIGTLALARKLAGIAASTLGAFAAFGFVAVDTGAARWETASEPIRAGIARDLEVLRAARQQGAALAWAAALVEAERRRAPAAAADWQVYLAEGERLCRESQTHYLAGYEAATASHRLARLCDVDAFRTRLVAARLGPPAVPRSDPDPVAWLPDFPIAARPSDPAFDTVGTLDAPSPSVRLRDLQSLRARLSSGLNDADKARGAAEGALAKAAGEWLGAVSPALAEGVAKSLTDALLEIVVRENGRAAIERLRLARLPLSSTARALLGLAPVALDSPGPAGRRPGPIGTQVKAVWNAAFPVPPLGPELAAYGRSQAARADAQDRMWREVRRREADQTHQMLERATELRLRETARR